MGIIFLNVAGLIYTWGYLILFQPEQPGENLQTFVTVALADATWQRDTKGDGTGYTSLKVNTTAISASDPGMCFHKHKQKNVFLLLHIWFNKGKQNCFTSNMVSAMETQTGITARFPHPHTETTCHFMLQIVLDTLWFSYWSLQMCLIARSRK